ncbi:MAG: hypothetical protein P1U87_14795 [Verrucomicrobiales bacterium]|nr:hypothetical protein [Verrucomicrobiales bacterium]
MRAAAIAFAILLVSATAGAWGLESGDNIYGTPLQFDFASKTVEFSNRDAAGSLTFPARDLSFRSKQRLLINQVFLSSFPEEPTFSTEKVHLLLLAILSPMAVLLIGFWIAGILLARKVSPIRALVGCLGGWILGTTFVIFYLFFAARLGGDYKLVLFGAGLGMIVLSVFISAVYQCSILRGFLIFFAQIFVALFLAIVGLATTESLIEKEKVHAFWGENVFEPVGMVPAHENG